ncbi:cation acetate symporter [Streptomyces cupreus]|uniref:Cation acetate symporter n=1 Tax=Streptomyces cupreus TaxID=2759956 RepID=A0A7X1MB43_9ACTN|nr:cation acetate symporter [Streptomyces cupreus]MBC2904822.1 cation acetate symporter [Streptomyces cupreus]
MNSTHALTSSEQPYPAFAIFVVCVVCALLLSVWFSPHRDTTEDFFINNRRLTAAQSGLAMFGEYISAAALLGVPGLIALSGYDGLLYLLGPIIALTIILFLIAEPFHTSGRFTIADAVARRLRPRPVHTALGISTLAASMLYLIAQLVGAGALAAPILGLAGPAAQRALVASLGILMILYVVIGGMKAATVMQCIKAVVLLAGSGLLAILVLAEFGWNPGALLTAATRMSSAGDALLRPGLLFNDDLTGQLDVFSLQLAFVLGAASLPHLLTRLCAVPTARTARSSVRGAAVLTSVFGLIVVVLGFGATAILGSDAIPHPGNTATLLLAEALGGPLLLAMLAFVVFATILAVVSGVMLAAATSLAHDIYRSTIKAGRTSDKRELFVARSAVVLIGGTAITMSMYVQNINASLLIGLSFAVAASANLPTLLFTFYWKGFTATGAAWSVYGGLISSLGLAVFSPAVSGNPRALLPTANFAYFPLQNPGLVSIPLSFLLGWLGSTLGRERADEISYAEWEVRTLTDTKATRPGH